MGVCQTISSQDLVGEHVHQANKIVNECYVYHDNQRVYRLRYIPCCDNTGSDEIGYFEGRLTVKLGPTGRIRAIKSTV